MGLGSCDYHFDYWTRLNLRGTRIYLVPFCSRFVKNEAHGLALLSKDLYVCWTTAFLPDLAQKFVPSWRFTNMNHCRDWGDFLMVVVSQ